MFKNTFAAAVLAGVAAAQSMQPACIMEEPSSVGSRSNEAARYDFYDRADFSLADVPSNYRIRQVVACVDHDDGGKLTGFTFQLADPADADALTSGAYVELPWMGRRTNTCTATPIVDRIKKIRTYQDGGDIVQGLAFKEPGGAWTSFNIPESRLPRYRRNIITWTFAHPEEPVIGMYGHAKNRHPWAVPGLSNDDPLGILQLGWLQLDTNCQDDNEAGPPGTGTGTHRPRNPTPRPAPTPIPGENAETV